ncbi:hypothetical protein [Streptomyces sp. NPDC057694]|uniref:hypothetical protein n=1 Tax=Streptomyces sp. NPDC057694 TaxID=3346216 RepID=UPI0036AF2D15
MVMNDMGDDRRQQAWDRIWWNLTGLLCLLSGMSLLGSLVSVFLGDRPISGIVLRVACATVCAAVVWLGVRAYQARDRRRMGMAYGGLLVGLALLVGAGATG